MKPDYSQLVMAKSIIAAVELKYKSPEGKIVSVPNTEATVKMAIMLKRIDASLDDYNQNVELMETENQLRDPVTKELLYENTHLGNGALVKRPKYDEEGLNKKNKKLRVLLSQFPKVEVQPLFLSDECIKDLLNFVDLRDAIYFVGLLIENEEKLITLFSKK